MDRHIHFISGLPRSGSTLLSALLQQSPRFHAGMRGPPGGVFGTLLHQLSGQDGFSVFINDTPVNDPARALAAVYDFIGEPLYAHDFERASFDDKGFDKRAGTPGLHHVRARVAATARQSSLPPDLFRRFGNDPFWRDPQLDPRDVRLA